jgi:hypothetical protein
MKDADHTCLAGVRDHRGHIIISVARVDHDGQSQFSSEAKLRLEGRALCVRRRVVVVIV